VTYLAALCGDERLLDAWRREGFKGTVHSVFDRVVNLADESGALVSLAARSLYNAPNTLIVDAPSFNAFALRAGMDSATRGAMICVEECRLAVGFDAAAAWRAWLPDHPNDETRLRANLAAVRAELRADTSTLLAAPAAAIARAVRQDDREGLRAHARAVLGLGPGLTPSGDDFLVGLFAVLNLAHGPRMHWRDLCSEVVAEASSRTHAISLAALHEAARGRVRESISHLLRELVGGQRAGVAGALARVLAIGATSGRDIVAGIVCAMTALTEIEAEIPS